MIFVTRQLANAADHRLGAHSARFGTATSSPGSVHLLCSAMLSHFKSEKDCGPAESNSRRTARSRRLSQNAIAAMMNANAATPIFQEEGSVVAHPMTSAMPPMTPIHERSASRTHLASVQACHGIKMRRQRATNCCASGIVINVCWAEVIRQVCLSSRFGMIGQRVPAADESVRFITATFTPPGLCCKGLY